MTQESNRVNSWVKVKNGGDNIYFDYNGNEYRAGRAEGISSGTPASEDCDGRVDGKSRFWRCYAEKTIHNPQGYHYEYHCVYDEKRKEIKITGEIKKHQS